jgi:hypothetical protein
MWWFSDVKLSSGACCARVAIVCCRVEMVSDLGMSGIVPLRRSAIRRPLPSTGSFGSVPRLHQYFGALRLPAALPAALRCLRLAVPLFALVLRSRRRPSAATAGQGLGVTGCPSCRSTRGDGRTSQVPGEPRCAHALLFDPGGTSAPGHLGASVLPSAATTTSAPTTTTFGAPSHGLLTRCLRFVTTITRGHARLASGCWPSFAGRGWLPAGFPRKVSELVTSHPPCPGLSWRTVALGSAPQRAT